MAKKSERSLVLLCVLFVFVCLLLSGGSRLIGSNMHEENLPERPFASIRTVLCAPAGQISMIGSVQRREQGAQKEQSAPSLVHRNLNPRVTRDANGNVLASRTYMREVYQAFALDDGFV